MRRAARLTVPLLAVLALALLGASLFVGAGPVEAQGWTCYYNFANGQQTWTANDGGTQYGANWSGSSWTHNDKYFSSAYRRGLDVQITFSSTTVTSVSLTATLVSGNVDLAGSHRGFLVVGSTQVQEFTPSVSPSGYSWTGSISATSLRVGIVSDVTSTSTRTGSASLSQVVVSGTGTQPSTCGATPTPAPSNTPTNTPTPTPIPPTATPATQTIVYNFRTGQNGWVAANGITAYSAGSGFVSTGTTSEMLGAPWYDTYKRHRNYISYCTENNVKVMSVEMLVSINGASQAYHDWSAAFRDGSITGGAVIGNQDTGSNLTRTLTLGTQFTHSGMFFDLSTADLNFSGNAAAVSADVVASTYIIEQLTVVFATGYTPVACAGNTSPTVTLDCPADATVNTTATLTATTTGTINAWHWDFGDGNTSTEADGSVEFSWPIADTYTVDVSVFGPGGSGSDSCVITVYRIGQPRPDGSGALYRPLLTTDSDPSVLYTNTQLGLISPAAAWGGDALVDSGPLYSSAKNETVIGFSQVAGANVYSVADGTVLSVDLLAAGACGPMTNGLSNGVTCQTNLYAEGLTGDIAPYATMQFSTAGLYRVTMSFATGITLEYYVANAPQYVRQGQVLLAGCIIGETTPYTLRSNTAGVPDQSGKETFWMQAVQAGGTQVPILAQLYTDPDPATACNAGGDYSDCLFDPMFTSQGGYTWARQGGVTWGQGVTLEPGASISLNGLNLDAATAYSFTVWTETPRSYTPGDARITLGIGTTETSFLIDASIRSPWTIASATHTADQGSLYSIRILNSGRAPFTVLQNCVSTGEPNAAPSSCYFQNFSFDGQFTNWTTTGTIVPADAPGSLYVMSDLATIGQNVKLYADGGGGDHEYTVRLEGVLHATANSLIQVRYRFGGGGWILPDVNGWTLSQQSLTALQRTYVLEFDVPSGTFSGLMEFQFDFTPTGGDAVGTTLSLQLYSLCLQDGSGWADYPGGGGSGWTPGTGCDNNAPPVELQDDFGAWIAYHLKGMENIYYCDVIPQLDRLNNITYGIYEYAQWTGLYSQAAQSQAMLWADKQLFPWLGGYLSNIANAAGGRITVDPGGGCHDLFCLLDAIVQSVIGPIVDLVGRIIDTILSLINTAANLLIPLIEAIIGFFVTIINGLAGILNSLITLITAFITGISNAQPAPVPGLPNCAIDPSSNAICAVMYGLQNTVFSDEGSAILPLFIAILSIVQLQWFIAKITELIAEVTDRL
jgi:hypothetical protein